MNEREEAKQPNKGCLQGLLCSTLCVDVCGRLLCVRCSRKYDICHVGSFVTMVTYRRGVCVCAQINWSHGNSSP